MRTLADSLYEVLEVMLFIERHGADTADRYLKFDIVQTAKNVSQNERLHDVLGHPPLEEGRLEDIQAERDTLIADWEAAPNAKYLWAAQGLGITNPKAMIDFGQLERDVKLEHLRLYYSLASNHIHANVRGLNEDPWEDMEPSMRQLSLAESKGWHDWPIAPIHWLDSVQPRIHSDSHRILMNSCKPAHESFRRSSGECPRSMYRCHRRSPPHMLSYRLSRS